MVTVELKSGMFTGSPEELKGKIKAGYQRAIFNAINQTIEEFFPTIAQDTGILRLELELYLLNQVYKISFDTTLFFEVPLAPSYAKYHVLPPKGEAKQDFYISPTTPGTKPIDPEVLLKTLKTAIQENLLIELNQTQGLDFRVAVGGVD